jgi:hypothetical protein
VSDETVAALGKASEALEYVERARGHLYTLHQLIGRADLLFEAAAELLLDAGHDIDADEVCEELVGRNVLEGRWTFQVVEEFEASYWTPVRDLVRRLERDHVQGHRHVYEQEMKEQRRTRGREGHERRPHCAGPFAEFVPPPD